MTSSMAPWKKLFMKGATSAPNTTELPSAPRLTPGELTVPTRAPSMYSSACLVFPLKVKATNCHTPCCKGRPRHRVVCRISAIDNIQPIGAWIRVHDKGTKTADTEGFTHDRSTTRSIRTDPGGQCQIGNVEVAVVENFNEGGETVEFIGVVRVTEPIGRQGCALNNTVVAGTAFVLRVSIEWQEGNGSCRKGQSGMNGRVVVVTVACNQTVGRWYIAKRIVHNGHVTPTEIILVLVEIRDGVRRRRTTVSGCNTACTDPVGSRATPIEIHGRGMTTITTGIQQHVVERRIGFFRESLVEIVNRDESVSGSADLTTRDFGDFSFAQCAVPDADFVDRSIPDFGVPIKLRSDVKVGIGLSITGPGLGMTNPAVAANTPSM